MSESENSLKQKLESLTGGKLIEVRNAEPQVLHLDFINKNNEPVFILTAFCNHTEITVSAEPQGVKAVNYDDKTGSLSVDTGEATPFVISAINDPSDVPAWEVLTNESSFQYFVDKGVVTSN